MFTRPRCPTTSMILSHTEVWGRTNAANSTAGQQDCSGQGLVLHLELSQGTQQVPYLSRRRPPSNSNDKGCPVQPVRIVPLDRTERGAEGAPPGSSHRRARLSNTSRTSYGFTHAPTWLISALKLAPPPRNVRWVCIAQEAMDPPAKGTHYSEIKAFTTKDGSVIRELMHPSIHGSSQQSLAEATVPVGATTFLHQHSK